MDPGFHSALVHLSFLFLHSCLTTPCPKNVSTSLPPCAGKLPLVPRTQRHFLGVVPRARVPEEFTSST